MRLKSDGAALFMMWKYCNMTVNKCGVQFCGLITLGNLPYFTCDGRIMSTLQTNTFTVICIHFSSSISAAQHFNKIYFLFMYPSRDNYLKHKIDIG